VSFLVYLVIEQQKKVKNTYQASINFLHT